uniref:Anticodon-binding domain-containing protein n=1 Tax=Phlebotomus papatasi TaxID=29031 RepID=A0A1B0D3H6_PHLPP
MPVAAKIDREMRYPQELIEKLGSQGLLYMCVDRQMASELTGSDVSHKVDDSSGSIGRRYARTDEIAIPYGITIDFDTLKEPHTVTLRERDSMAQVRIPVNEIADVVRRLASGKSLWTEIEAKYPKFEQQESSAK